MEPHDTDTMNWSSEINNIFSCVPDVVAPYQGLLRYNGYTK
jgi:hypothetical protein